MSSINVVEKAKTLEDYEASNLSITSNARLCAPYQPVTVPKTEEFQGIGKSI